MTTPDPKPSGDWKPGSPSSVFRPDSAGCTAALNDLAVVMKRIGFIVDKKRVSENTLRVYVRKRLTYPLLNPRFQRRSIRGLTGRAILEITALSKGDEALGRRLAAFPSSATAVSSPPWAPRAAGTLIMATSPCRYLFEAPAPIAISMLTLSSQR